VTLRRPGRDPSLPSGQSRTALRPVLPGRQTYPTAHSKSSQPRGRMGGPMWQGGCYRVEPPPGSRLRRKLVRFDGGSASRRRICWTSARSDSRLSAVPRLAFESDFFIQCPSQHRQHRPILRSVGGPFALDDVLQGGHQ